jgi:hypothetical protein
MRRKRTRWKTNHKGLGLIAVPILCSGAAAVKQTRECHNPARHCLPSSATNYGVESPYSSGRTDGDHKHQNQQSSFHGLPPSGPSRLQSHPAPMLIHFAAGFNNLNGAAITIVSRFGPAKPLYRRVRRGAQRESISTVFIPLVPLCTSASSEPVLSLSKGLS